MTGIVLTVNNQDISGVLSSYEVIHEDEVEIELTTIDGKRHRYGKRTRTTILFDVLPCQSGLSVLRDDTLSVTFTDQEYGTTRTMECELISGRRAKYLLQNAFGNTMSKMDGYALECVEVDSASNIG